MAQSCELADAEESVGKQKAENSAILEVPKDEKRFTKKALEEIAEKVRKKHPEFSPQEVAQESSERLRRTIQTLCHDDHHGDDGPLDECPLVVLHLVAIGVDESTAKELAPGIIEQICEFDGAD